MLFLWYFAGSLVKKKSMEATSELWFAPFRLELCHEQLWREDQPIPLRPKTFAVLRHLVTRLMTA